MSIEANILDPDQTAPIGAVRSGSTLFVNRSSLYIGAACLADEIAEPRPDMDIKVAAFTVSEQSINSDWKGGHAFCCSSCVNGFACC